MQTRNPFLDDISKLAQGAAGAAQAAGDEVRALFRSQGERMATDLDLVRREEVEALKTLARTAIEKAEALEKRVAELEARLVSAGAAPATAPKG
jgi:BMFP domain-containing protein YqiC